ncbi:MAG TPA: glycosyltransferase [Acidimicrobiales bacterium]|nr:glycosyltransferase [Acidimicrobiales bacterium]
MSGPGAPRRLRVLRVIARLNVGGPALHVSLLTSRLDPDRFESLLAAGSPGEREGDMLALRPDLAVELGERLVTIPGLGRDVRPGADLRALRGLEGLVRRFRPHVVHTHTAKAGALGRLVAAGRRTPVIVHTFHGTVFGGHFHPVAGRAAALAERGLGRLSDAVLAVSPTVASELARHHVGRGRVRVVPLGLDLAPFAAVPALEGAPPPVLTLVARLAPVKDVPLFLEAAEMARRRVPALRVRIAGDGPLRSEIEAIAPPWAELLGHRGDLPALLADSGVVALSSRSEGSPVALIEALAAARPVVSVPVGGVVDILRGRPGALLATDRSAGALADAIVQALGDASLARAAAAGRAQIVCEFGIERLVADIEALYEELWEAHSRLSSRRLSEP